MGGDSVVARVEVAAAEAMDSRGPAIAAQVVDAVGHGKIVVHGALAVVVARQRLAVDAPQSSSRQPTRRSGSSRSRRASAR